MTPVQVQITGVRGWTPQESEFVFLCLEASFPTEGETAFSAMKRLSKRPATKRSNSESLQHLHQMERTLCQLSREWRQMGCCGRAYRRKSRPAKRLY